MPKAAPPPDITGAEWVEKHRRYSVEGPSPGRHDNKKAPYQVEPLNSCCDNTTREVTLMWSSQVGKTNIVENTIAFRSKNNPGPMMMVCARVEDAEDFSKDRLMPMIRATPILHDVFGDEKAKTSGSTILKKKILGGFLKLGGANSPASLAMRAIRDLFCDEKDRYPVSAGSEGDPSALAAKRTATFFNSKKINISSPGIKGHSPIEKDYERSDMREYFVECPHCKTDIILKHDQLKCVNEDPETTCYVCQSCDAIIDESEKSRMMVETGKWVPQKPFKGHAGFRISEMYSPFRRWADIMKDWIEAKGDTQKMKVFINTSKAETYEISGEVLAWEALYGRRESYPIGIVPKGGLFVTASADIQKNRIEVEIKAWGRGKQSWSVDHIVLPGMTSDDKVWKDLEDVVSNVYPHECGGELPIRMMAVDSGYSATRVYDFVRKFPRNRVIAVKGGPSSMITMVSPPKSVDVERGSGKRRKSGPRVWTVGGDLIKSEFFANLVKEKPTEEELAVGAGYPSGYCHYPEYKEDFFKQLTTEVLAPRKASGGQIVYEYRKLNHDDRNEAIDLHVYNRAVANILGIDRFKDYHWESFEEQLGVVYESPKEADRKAGDKVDKRAPEKKRKKGKVIIKSSGFVSR